MKRWMSLLTPCLTIKTQQSQIYFLPSYAYVHKWHRKIIFTILCIGSDIGPEISHPKQTNVKSFLVKLPHLEISVFFEKQNEHEHFY